MNMRTMIAVAAVAASAMAAMADDVPDSFIDYVESTGSQYVDTGIIGRYATKVEVRFSGWAGANTSLFGAISNSVHYLADRAYSNKLRFIYNLSQSKNGTDFSTAAGENANNIYHVTTVEVTDDGTMRQKLDGNGFTTLTSGKGQHSTNLGMYLFAANRDGGMHRNCSARLFGCRIWQDGDLVRDVRPCMKDGVPGLYDAVERKIYFPGAGTLAAPTDEPRILEYAESSGSQYVDTGIVGRYGTTVAVKYSDMTVSGRAMFGSVNTDNYHFLGMRNGGNLRFTYGTSGSAGDTNTAVTYDSTPHEVKTEVSADGAVKIYVDGNENATTTVPSLGQFSTDLNMYLFNGNSEGAYTLWGSVKLYGCKIWQDGDLVRDFAPCEKDDLVGMYDRVSEIFYPSVGTLTKGPELAKPLKFVEYVESTGSQYVDTGVVGRYGTAVEADYAGWDANMVLFGTHNNGCHFLAYRYGNNFRFIYNNSSTYTGTTFGDDVRRRVIGEVTRDGTMNVTIDGTKTKTASSLGQYNTSLNMYLFAGNSGGNPGWQSKTKLYGCRIWQDGTLVRDFRPCIAANGKAALWDEVESKHYYPVGDLTASSTEVPATATWKGGAVGSAADLAAAANWDCRNPTGVALEGLVPSAATTVVITNASDALLAVPSGIAAQGWGETRLGVSIALSAAADWRALGRLTLAEGVSLDLNGNALVVADLSAPWGASVVNSAATKARLTAGADGITSLTDLTLGNKVQFTKAGVGTMGVTASEMNIGKNGSLSIDMEGGEFWINGVMRVAPNNVGSLSIVDGTKVYVNDGSVGHNNGAVGVLDVSGGEFYSANNLWFGPGTGSSGTFLQSGGTVTIATTLWLAGQNASCASAHVTLEQTGGTLETGEIYQGYGTAEITFNGGTLKPNKANAKFFDNLRDVRLGGNGVTINTAYNIGATGTTITVRDGGKITKAGAGVFDLSGLTVQIGEGTTRSFDFAVAGADAGGFTGLPTVPGGWTAKLCDDGKRCRISRKGFVLIVK